MIERQFTGDFATMNLYLHGANSVTAQTDKIVVNGIPYSAKFHYEVKDMILTETYRFVTRTDDFQKEATYKQKNVVGEKVKMEVFNYLFSYPEVLKEAETVRIGNEAVKLIKERTELEDKLADKQRQVINFYLDNPDLGTVPPFTIFI